MSKNFFKSGDWNVICDVCGKKIKASESKHRWDGFIVCFDDFETRHSLDFIRSRSDKITVPFTRPRPEDVFIVVNLTAIPSDVVTFEESVNTTAEFYRYIGLQSNILDRDTLNGFLLNSQTLNSASVDPSPPTTTESISISENVQTTIIPFLVTNQVLNGAIYNEVTLG